MLSSQQHLSREARKYGWDAFARSSVRVRFYWLPAPIPGKQLPDVWPGRSEWELAATLTLDLQMTYPAGAARLCSLSKAGGDPDNIQFTKHKPDTDSPGLFPMARYEERPTSIVID